MRSVRVGFGRGGRGPRRGRAVRPLPAAAAAAAAARRRMAGRCTGRGRGGGGGGGGGDEGGRALVEETVMDGSML